MEKRDSIELLEIESPWICQPGVVRVLRLASEGAAVAVQAHHS